MIHNIDKLEKENIIEHFGDEFFNRVETLIEPLISFESKAICNLFEADY